MAARRGEHHVPDAVMGSRPGASGFWRGVGAGRRRNDDDGGGNQRPASGALGAKMGERGNRSGCSGDIYPLGLRHRRRHGIGQGMRFRGSSLPIGSRSAISAAFHRPADLGLPWR